MRWLVLALVLGGAARVHAQAVSHEETPTQSTASPQRFGIELRLGPYYPDVDSEFGGPVATRPHHVYFGSSRRLMSQLEFDYQFFQGFGTAAIGLAVGYYRESARAFIESSSGMMTTTRSGDTTRLALIPVSALLIYRLDVGARRWRFPLVPYAKVGLNYTFWTITDGNDETATGLAMSGKGSGGTPGWQAAFGLSFLLDAIDFGAAKALDSDVGVNHTYLFIEAMHVDANGLGRKGVLDVGGSTWMAGLFFEF